MRCEGKRWTMGRSIAIMANIFAKIFATIWKTWYFHVMLFTFRFFRDFHKSNFRATGKLWLLSVRTDRYVMWYGAIIAATGYICCCYYYRCCCFCSCKCRCRHRRRYCCYCCCFSCSFSRRKKSTWFNATIRNLWPVYTVHCTIVQFYLKFKSKWKQVVWFDFNNKFHLKCRKCIANTLYFST